MNGNEGLEIITEMCEEDKGFKNPDLLENEELEKVIDDITEAMQDMKDFNEVNTELTTTEYTSEKPRKDNGKNYIF